MLGELVRRVTGQDVHAFSHEHVFGPLGMTETGYLPANRCARKRPSRSSVEGRQMQGEVHDPRAYLLGGVAGHAGCFPRRGSGCPMPR